MYREIVTRAVVGKGRISNEGEVVVNASNQVSKVLGCWVINHYYISEFSNGKVYAKGKYDIHVWYGFNNDSDTIVHKQTVDYNEEFNLNLKKNEELNSNQEFVIRCVKYPSCSGLSLKEDGTISVKIEKDLSLDIIGEAKLKVQISSEEEWVTSDDLDNINVNYLNKD